MHTHSLAEPPVVTETAYGGSQSKRTLQSAHGTHSLTAAPDPTTDCVTATSRHVLQRNVRVVFEPAGVPREAVGFVKKLVNCELVAKLLL